MEHWNIIKNLKSYVTTRSNNQGNLSGRTFCPINAGSCNF